MTFQKLIFASAFVAISGMGYRIEASAASVNLVQPTSGSTVSSSFTISANCGVGGANAIQGYLDGSLIFNQNVTSINYSANASLGSHQLEVKCWVGGAVYSSGLNNFNVTAANVVVNSPAENSTLSSPFTLNANCAVSGANAIQAYLDGNLVYNQNGTSVNTSVNASAGAHHLEIKCWAQSNAYTSGIINFSTSMSTGFSGSAIIPNPPSSAQRVIDIQKFGNWSQSTGALSSCPNGVPNPNCNPPNANYSSVYQSGDPSYLNGSSGTSGVFQLNQSPSWSTVVWGHPVLSSVSARNFIWDFYVYVDSTNYYSSELDLYTTLNNGQRFMMGTQCNRVTNSWDTWDESQQTWITNSNIPCNQILTAGSWHHVTYFLTLNTQQNSYSYPTIRVDGVDYVPNPNVTTYAQYSGWPEGQIGVQVQLDANGSGNVVKQFIENMQVYAW